MQNRFGEEFNKKKQKNKNKTLVHIKDLPVHILEENMDAAMT